MAPADGLGPLQVRVPREEDVPLAVGEEEQALRGRSGDPQAWAQTALPGKESGGVAAWSKD